VIADIRPTEIDSVRALRHLLLRPHQAPEQLAYEGDDAWDSLHVGAYIDRELVGIASIVRQAPPGEVNERAWRVRGMATTPQVRGLGYGGALLERCLGHAIEHGGTLVWCNARADAVGFYRRFGFEVQGESFDLPPIGTHFLMTRGLGTRRSDR
jgi:ribosomal protein S18 acetylase RimI-like enzyme